MTMVMLILSVLALIASVIIAYTIIVATFDNVTKWTKLDVWYAILGIIFALIVPVYIVLNIVERIW